MNGAYRSCSQPSPCPAWRGYELSAPIFPPDRVSDYVCTYTLCSCTDCASIYTHSCPAVAVRVDATFQVDAKGNLQPKAIISKNQLTLCYNRVVRHYCRWIGAFGILQPSLAFTASALTFSSLGRIDCPIKYTGTMNLLATKSVWDVAQGCYSTFPPPAVLQGRSIGGRPTTTISRTQSNHECATGAGATCFGRGRLPMHFFVVIPHYGGTS